MSRKTIREKGIDLKMLFGEKKPSAPSAQLVESLQQAEVTHRDEQRSGFQLTFSVSQGGQQGRIKTSKARDVLSVGKRVHLGIVLGAQYEAIMNGVITNRQISPVDQPGQAQLTITGEDQSWFLDKEEASTDYAGQSDVQIVKSILGEYSTEGLSPNVEEPDGNQSRNANEQAPTQQASDLQYVRALADKHGHRFYIRPEGTPYQSEAYWGSPETSGTSQPELLANMGTETNVTDVQFRQDQSRVERFEASVQDRDSNDQTTVTADKPNQTSLADSSAYENDDHVQTRRIQADGSTIGEARHQVQARTNNAGSDVVSGQGTLFPERYGDVLKPRKLVDLYGVGSGFDGTYYVEQVTHRVQKGSYRQNFRISREGTEE